MISKQHVLGVRSDTGRLSLVVVVAGRWKNEIDVLKMGTTRPTS